MSAFGQERTLVNIHNRLSLNTITWSDNCSLAFCAFVG